MILRKQPAREFMDLALTLTLEQAKGVLSPRELEVLNWMGQGYGATSVAAKMFVSVKTVSAYTLRIKEKLKCNSLFEVRYLAMRWAKEKERPKDLMTQFSKDAGNWRALVQFVMEKEGLVYPPDLREG
jgi:DNA-binding CsgD family transcriptional regulator